MTDRLQALRKDIDALDHQMVQLLAQRQQLVAEVLAYKMQHQIPARIPARIDEVINNAASQAERLGADPDLARTVWSAMVEWFVRHEERALTGSQDHLPAPPVCSASRVR